MVIELETNFINFLNYFSRRDKIVDKLPSSYYDNI